LEIQVERGKQKAVEHENSLQMPAYRFFSGLEEAASSEPRPRLRLEMPGFGRLRQYLAFYMTQTIIESREHP
jgi:hypothetical protein